MNRLRRLLMSLGLSIDAWAFETFLTRESSPISWRDHARWWLQDIGMTIWACGYTGSLEELDDAFHFPWEHLNARQREHFRSSTWSIEKYRGGAL